MVKSVILCQVGKGFHFQKSIANKVSSWVPDPPGAPLARVPGGSPPPPPPERIGVTPLQLERTNITSRVLNLMKIKVGKTIYALKLLVFYFAVYKFAGENIVLVGAWREVCSFLKAGVSWNKRQL